MTTSPWTEKKPTAVLVFADGTVVRGHGVGATGEARAEVCFNTALTGYQEILTDPSYLGQIVTFTFPHIGNIGANDEDIEDLTPAAHIGAVGVIFKADITEPSNYRSAGHFDAWLKARGIVGLSGVDTRADRLDPRNGAPNAVIAHDPSGEFDIEALTAKAAEWSGLEGLDLARDATSGQSSSWTQAPWVWERRLRRNR
jgi:carbamoyl-phosphate synthase small subunit